VPAFVPPVARTQMLIRRPAAEVYDAFVDPAVTTRFWFTRSSGPLLPDTTVTWHWDMYGATANVEVIALEQDARIVVHWPTPVEWRFEPRGDSATLVTITASGFTGTEQEQTNKAIDSMGGFTFVLAGCKAWLEHAIHLTLVRDHNPDHHVTNDASPSSERRTNERKE
jgi:uncharacterized protein YndB with AHSA1/START domain